MISVTIPIYNEEGNIPVLYEKVTSALRAISRPWELIFVNDGSNDASEELLDEIAEKDPNVKVVHFRRNFGQTAAMMAGFNFAKGDIIIPMDGDLQNEPGDIPALLAKLDEGFDVVSGWRKDRQDNALKRNLPSIMANKLISFVMLTVSGLLLLVALAGVSAISVVQASWFATVTESMPRLMVLQSFAIRWATTILFILVVGLVFYFVPNAKVRFRDVWVGAVLTGLLWRGALWGFSFYVRDLSRFNVHGSIAAVVVFLLWVYISAFILLFGAEVTAAYARLRRHRPEEVPAAPTPR